MSNTAVEGQGVFKNRRFTPCLGAGAATRVSNVNTTMAHNHELDNDRKPYEEILVLGGVA